MNWVFVPPQTQHFFIQIREHFKEYTEIYTDGSKLDKCVGTAVTCQDTVIQVCWTGRCKNGYSGF